MGDRIEILEAIGEHLIQVTKFLRILSASDEPEGQVGVHDPSKYNANDKVDFIKKPARKPSMNSIPEEDFNELTDHIADVSLHESLNDKNDKIERENNNKNNANIKRKRY